MVPVCSYHRPWAKGPVNEERLSIVYSTGTGITDGVWLLITLSLVKLTVCVYTVSQYGLVREKYSIKWCLEISEMWNSLSPRGVTVWHGTNIILPSLHFSPSVFSEECKTRQRNIYNLCKWNIFVNCRRNSTPLLHHLTPHSLTG